MVQMDSPRECHACCPPSPSTRRHRSPDRRRAIITSPSSPDSNSATHFLKAIDRKDQNPRDLGEHGFFLGIEIVKYDDGILLSQACYMNDILKRAGMAECKHLSTPIPDTKSVTFNTYLYDDPTRYRSLAGALQYLTITRSDVSFVVNQLCQQMHAPTASQWEQLKRVLRYVKGTLTFGLRIRNSVSKEIHAFSDSDWAGCP
ncbi:uncharacterized protein LOC116013141 [Ipomoea triloba]|uniref:uncharacterized protein LOC116013141 n=1 Tax=Ipomoea triloba TaxID=35885 RepID=UPI00125D50D2|nr:uncharacterized protein LOC116013141 [Ipomoea triloba]